MTAGLVSSAPSSTRAQRWPDGYFTAADGTRLHYVDAGSGTPVVLIHGSRGSAIGNWFSNGIAPRLIETNRVLALDLRGHGLSGGSGHDHTTMGEDVLAFMNHRGVERAHVGGYSMGGAIMLQVMMKAPERFITACFQGSGVRELDEFQHRIPHDKAGKDPDEERANAVVRARREARGEEIGNNIGQRVREFMPALRDGRAMAAMHDMHERHRAQAAAIDLGKIDFPVMAINGEFDRPNSRTHRLARELRDFTNLVLPGKSHLTAMMADFIPQAYIDGYAAFITRHNPIGDSPEADCAVIAPRLGPGSSGPEGRKPQE